MTEHGILPGENLPEQSEGERGVILKSTARSRIAILHCTCVGSSRRKPASPPARLARRSSQPTGLSNRSCAAPPHLRATARRLFSKAAIVVGDENYMKST